jgi:hypothetical protein
MKLTLTRDGDAEEVRDADGHLVAAVTKTGGRYAWHNAGAKPPFDRGTAARRGEAFARCGIRLVPPRRRDRGTSPSGA